MEWLNDRLVLLAAAAHTRHLLCQMELDGGECDAAYTGLVAQLDQQEAALAMYDAMRELATP